MTHKEIDWLCREALDWQGRLLPEDGPGENIAYIKELCKELHEMKRELKKQKQTRIPQARALVWWGKMRAHERATAILAYNDNHTGCKVSLWHLSENDVAQLYKRRPHH